MKRRITFITLITLLAALLAMALSGCGATIDASKARSRGLINRGYIVPADEVHVAEYLNYYEQRFPEPTDAPLALDVRLGNPQVSPAGGDVWLQVGLQAIAAPEGQRTPLNLALVLDRSGSMGETDKMDYLKQSLEVFLHSLRPDDIVSIVAYNDTARVLRPAQPVGDGGWIHDTVQRLQPVGWTNLNAGMMLGFEEVEKNFDIRRNNRVILLTDGIANRGVIDPQRIAENARAYNDRGIYLSTIGLGVSLDDDLLHTLAQQGHGAYHFIDSWDEMDKVFRQEADGLVEKVARDISITIEAEGGELDYVVGYEGDPPPQGATVQMRDMGAGDSQVLLAKFQAAPLRGPVTLARITLAYTDVFGQRQRSETRAVRIAPGRADEDPLADIEVRRNVTIVRSAQTLQGIDRLFEIGYYDDALTLARQMEAELREMAELTGDSQMVEDADLFRRYQMTLSQAIEAQAASEPRQNDASQQPQRWGVATPTPALPVINVD